nr:V-type proton ATPase subunit e 2 [Parasteatoda tepidariorum]
MGASAVPFVIFTLFWLLVGGVLPWFVPKGINRGYNTLFTFLFSSMKSWLCCYMVQMNPLFGPQLPTATLAVMKEVWKK